MLNVYIADLTGLEESYDEKVNLLHPSRADKLNAYKMPEDRVRGLGAGLLLERGLEDYLQASIPRDERGRYIIEYTYGPQGKPYLKDYPEIHFSLSHSGNMAVLALSDAEVGIDVQEHRGYNERITKRFFHEEERKMLENVSGISELEILFYSIWTCKEAYIKYTGKGMSQELSCFYWNSAENRIYDKDQNVVGCVSVPLEMKGYQCSVVSANISTKIDKIVKIII